MVARAGTIIAFPWQKVYHPTTPRSARLIPIAIKGYYLPTYDTRDIGNIYGGSGNWVPAAPLRAPVVNIPVGVSPYLTSPIEPTLSTVPPVGVFEDGEQATVLPPEIDRRDQISQTVGVVPEPFYVTKNTHPGAIAELIAIGVPIIYPPDFNSLVEEDEEVSWIEDVYTTVDAAVGGVLPGGAPLGIPTGWGGPGLGAQAPIPAPPVVINAGGGAVAPTVFNGGGNGCDDPMRGMVYKKVCGQFKWVKQKRRRRKRLASQSDIKDLSALIGLLGNGKVLQTWIATNS